MSLENVREHLDRYGKGGDIIEFDVSTATVELAAQALGTQPCRIAKTIALINDDHALLIVAAGDAKVDNRKFKEEFGIRAKMLDAEQVVRLTEHVVGGVCPFALPTSAELYLDESLKRFETVFPACGTPHTAIELTLAELEETTPFIRWVDACKLPEIANV